MNLEELWKDYGLDELEMGLDKLFPKKQLNLESLLEQVMAGDVFGALAELELRPAQLPAMVKMDLNLATTEELTIIPGIGESTAKNIIEYRNKIGRFYKIEDLLNVKGIGKKQLEEISKYATVAN